MNGHQPVSFITAGPDRRPVAVPARRGAKAHLRERGRWRLRRRAPPHVTLFRWPGPDGRRPTEIAAGAQISKQRVNDLLRDLEQMGYLRLEPDTADNRARIVRLTRRGKALHHRAVKAHAEVEAEWEAAVGKRRYTDLRKTLAQLGGGLTPLLQTRQ